MTLARLAVEQQQKTAQSALKDSTLTKLPRSAFRLAQPDTRKTTTEPVNPVLPTSALHAETLPRRHAQSVSTNSIS